MKIPLEIDIIDIMTLWHAFESDIFCSFEFFHFDPGPSIFWSSTF